MNAGMPRKEMNPEQFRARHGHSNLQEGQQATLSTWTEVLEVIHQLGYQKVRHRDLDLPKIFPNRICACRERIQIFSHR